MQHYLLGAMALSIGIVGCATKPVEEPDTTPLNTTAVIEHQVINNGIKGFFPSESTERHYVRANMRRDESTFKGTGTFSGYLIGKQAGTKITRLDRGLQWSLDTEKSEFTECPLKGCTQPSRQPAPTAEKPPEAQHESGCTMSIARSSFTVKATGQKKSINGFDADEYQATWVINLRDKAAQMTTSTMNIDIWTTPMTSAMRDALAMEESYARAYNGVVTDKQQVLPEDAARLIKSYLGNSLKPADLRAFTDAGRQMEKIRGYPISTRLNWSMEGNACAPKKAQKAEDKSASKSIPTSAGGIASSLAGMFAKKKTDEVMKEAAGEPILSFTFEIKSLRTEPVRDSVFTVPRNYRLVTQP